MTVANVNTQAAWAKVAPLEKKVNDLGDALVWEAQERSAVAERYQNEVIRVETLLT